MRRSRLSAARASAELGRLGQRRRVAMDEVGASPQFDWTAAGVTAGISKRAVIVEETLFLHASAALAGIEADSVQRHIGSLRLTASRLLPRLAGVQW